MLFGIIALVYALLEREDKFCETIYLLFGQGGCVSVLITGIVLGQNFFDGLGTTVIQIRAGTPYFNQCWRIKRLIFVQTLSGADIVFLKVGI